MSDKDELMRLLTLLTMVSTSCAFALLMIGNYSPFLMSRYAPRINELMYDELTLVWGAVLFLIALEAVFLMAWFLKYFRSRDETALNFTLVSGSHLLVLLILGIG